MPGSAPYLIIEGLTEDGQRFRPSDWIERLIDTLSSYGADRRLDSRPYVGSERRQRQVQFLQAQMIDGAKCLLVDERLRDANPLAYGFLMEFVRSNRLRWRAHGAPPAAAARLANY
jgi:hypothetical protein